MLLILLSSLQLCFFSRDFNKSLPFPKDLMCGESYSTNPSDIKPKFISLLRVSIQGMDFKK